MVEGGLLILVTFTSGARDPVRWLGASKIASNLGTSLCVSTYFLFAQDHPRRPRRSWFLTVIENLRPLLSSRFFLSFFLPSSRRDLFPTATVAAPPSPTPRHLHRALDAGLSFPFYRGRGIVRAALACSVGEIVSFVAESSTQPGRRKPRLPPCALESLTISSIR